MQNTFILLFFIILSFFFYFLTNTHPVYVPSSVRPGLRHSVYICHWPFGYFLAYILWSLYIILIIISFTVLLINYISQLSSLIFMLLYAYKFQGLQHNNQNVVKSMSDGREKTSQPKSYSFTKTSEPLTHTAIMKERP